MNIIADVGSCWGTSIDSAVRCIEMLAPYCNYVKFQLCPDNGINKPIDALWLPHLLTVGKKHGVQVSASVWDQYGYDAVKGSGAKWIKFAHSAFGKFSLLEACNDFQLVVATIPLMKPVKYQATNLVKLWCYEVDGKPQYPVMCKTNHSGLYTRYDGYSCHDLEMDEIPEKLSCKGAKWLEYHANPLGVANVPDSVFAQSILKSKLIAEVLDDLSDWS